MLSSIMQIHMTARIFAVVSVGQPCVGSRNLSKKDLGKYGSIFSMNSLA